MRYLLLALMLSGCASQFVQPQNMTPEQLAAWAKVKDASLGCARGMYAGATVSATWANIDKGIPAGITIKDDCTITFDGKK